MAASEDDHGSLGRPQAAVAEPHDVMDDADGLFLLFHAVPQRLGPLLGDVQYYQYGYAVFCWRVGWPVNTSVPAAGGSGTGRSSEYCPGEAVTPQRYDSRG